ncbi:MAG TPA: insulinase family protein [Parachlamydiaceae bacterium]|nr:insulinase family protein [Parachlamydiaceae bacterium]
MNINSTSQASAPPHYQQPTPQPLLEKKTKSKTANFITQIYDGIHSHLAKLNISKVMIESSPSKSCRAFISALLASCQSPIKPAEIAAIDPNLYKKTLANGLTFYVRKNDHPLPQKAYLRLVLRVGMLNETPEEKGIAHLIEHIAQIETASFPKNKIMNYLSLKGVQWSGDKNAHTGPEETVYELDIPLGDPETLEKSLFILSEVASKATLSEEVINNEREIVIAELSQNRSAWNRYANKKRAIKCAGSPYATLIDRDLEIESINKCPKEVIQAFYKRWYQPKNMAVIAVGDFDQKKTGDLVEKYFGKIPSSNIPPSEHKYKLEIKTGKQFLCFSAPGLTHSIVEIYHQLPALARADSNATLTENDIYRGLVIVFVEELLNTRLKDLSEADNPPFLTAGFMKEETIPDWPSTRLYAIAEDDEIPSAFKQLLLEIKRLKTHGFLQSEFDRIKKGFLADFDHQFREKGKTKPGVFINFYQAHFTSNMAAPDYDKYVELKQKVLEKLSLENINARIPFLFPEDNQFISTAQPQIRNLLPVTEEILKYEIEQSELAKVLPPAEENFDLPLLKHLPLPGRIAKISYHKNADITEYDLENGMKVFFKPTAFENDIVKMHAFSRYGMRDAHIAKLASAKFAQNFYDACGIGDYSLKTLQKILTNRKIGFSSSIQDYTTTIDATCVPKDFETAMQIFHLMFTNPGYERAAFDRAINEAEEDIRNMQNDPDTNFAHTCNAVNTQYHPHYLPLTLDDLKSIDYESCRDFHSQLHTNPADFTLTIVGNVQQTKVKQLVEHYLTGIPKTTERRSEFNYSPVTFPQGITHKDVIGNENSKCLTALTFLTPAIYDFKERCLSTWCCKLLEMRLNKVLRIEMGKTYSQTCSFINSVIPGHNTENPAKAMILLTYAPANKEMLEKEVLAQIRDLQVNGPSEIEINEYKTKSAISFSDVLKTNTGWSNAITANAMWNREQDHFDGFIKELENLNQADAKKQFIKLFSLDNFSVVSLLPQQEKECRDSHGNSKQKSN